MDGVGIFLPPGNHGPEPSPMVPRLDGHPAQPAALASNGAALPSAMLLGLATGGVVLLIIGLMLLASYMNQKANPGKSQRHSFFSLTKKREEDEEDTERLSRSQLP